MSVTTMDERAVEKILERIAAHVRRMANSPYQERNILIQEVADVIEYVTPEGLRYLVLSAQEAKGLKAKEK